MKDLSIQCKILLFSAVACLIAGIAVAPAGRPDPLFSADTARQAADRPAPGITASRDAQEAYRQVQNCTGGDSVNCHIAGNQAGL